MKRARFAALELVQQYGLIEPPALAQRLGIAYVEFAFAGRVRGLTAVRSGVRIIAVNRYLPSSWKRTVAAHELGHAILHDALHYYFLVDETFFPTGRYEREANEFAAELLIPDVPIDGDEQHEGMMGYLADSLDVPTELFRFKTTSSQNESR